MKLSDVIDSLSLTVVTGAADGCFEGVYAGDFLSRAMSRVGAGDLWITIMNNVNVIAVASLTDASAVLLAEDVSLMPDALDAAREKDVTVLSSGMSVYELCVALGKFGTFS
ncbi:MAG: hypothetical protein IKI03_02345 [Clostridia bacterium]|nr:hypothetical protein [Clostridia bacterium]